LDYTGLVADGVETFRITAISTDVRVDEINQPNSDVRNRPKSPGVVNAA
jgi:hypothetical protein